MFINKTENGFIELYGTWAGYGYGTMLVYVTPTKLGKSWKCEYVVFKENDGYKKEVIDQDLLDFYNRAGHE